MLYHASPSTFAALKADLIKESPELVAEYGLRITARQLEAMTERPDELVAEIALEYVLDARAKSDVWVNATRRARSHSRNEVLIFGASCLNSRWEYAIASGGISGDVLAWMVAEANLRELKEFWRSALITTVGFFTPPGVGIVAEGLWQLISLESAFTQGRTTFDSVDEWLNVYEPYALLMGNIGTSNSIIEARHADILSHLGITSNPLASCPSS